MEAVLRHPAAEVKPGNRLDLLRVLLTVGIVCLHATTTEVPSNTHAFELFTRGIILVTKICVPLFFIISGYLFFRNTPEKPDVKWFWGKVSSRFFTLVIPYLIANVIAWGCYWFAMNKVPSLVSGYFGDELTNPWFVFWKGPVNLSLWFIRELIVVVILSPLVFLLVRYLGWWGVLALGVLWGLKACPEPWFLFTAGACLGVHKIAPVERWLMAPGRIDTRCRAWTYFIYLYHYLLLIGIKKGLILLLQPQGTLALIGVWLASVVTVLGLLTGTYAILRRLLPGFTSIIVGGK